MDKKSKILLLTFLVLVIVVVAFTYYKYMVKRDYIIEAQADCDPYAEACFIWQCDPKSSEEGPPDGEASEACTGDPEEDIWYYQIVRRNAMNIPPCDPNDENCDALTCDPALEKDCEIILCDEETAVEQETKCNDPAEYIMNNPPEEEEECDPEEDEECVIEEEDEEETECEEGDEECITEEEGGEELTDESADLSEEE